MMHNEFVEEETGMFKDISALLQSTAVQRRREDVFSAVYVEGMTMEMVADFSGYSEATIEKDLRYIEAHLDEFDSHNLPQRILIAVEDQY